MFEQGTTVKFRGGTGRNDEYEIFEGTINGEAQEFKRERVTYIPVHLHKSNQNVMVELTNIVQEETE